MPWELDRSEKKLNMLEIDILQNSSSFLGGLLKGDFWGFGCPNNTKMPCWLKLWPWCFGNVQLNMLEIDILQNSSSFLGGVYWRVIFEGLGVQITLRCPAD